MFVCFGWRPNEVLRIPSHAKLLDRRNIEDAIVQVLDKVGHECFKEALVGMDCVSSEETFTRLNMKGQEINDLFISVRFSDRGQLCDFGGFSLTYSQSSIRIALQTYGRAN